MKARLFVFSAALTSLLTISTPANAHRSGCHRWHSCPSDSGSYICGDWGHCSGCPDNQYCQHGQPRVIAQSARSSATSQEVATTLLLKGKIVAVTEFDGDAFLIKVKDRYGFETPITAAYKTFSPSQIQLGTEVEVVYVSDPSNRAIRRLKSITLDE